MKTTIVFTAPCLIHFTLAGIHKSWPHYQPAEMLLAQLEALAFSNKYIHFCKHGGELPISGLQKLHLTLSQSPLQQMKIRLLVKSGHQLSS